MSGDEANCNTSMTDSWSTLPLSDQNFFFQLRHHFHHYKKPTGRDKRIEAFRTEILLCLHFIDKDMINRANRSRLIGMSIIGPFIIINTRILRMFLGRSKSSINGGLQQLGYVAVRNKVKAKQCMIQAIPTLESELSFMKQWSVRASSKNSLFCFLSKFPCKSIPEINDNDLLFEKAITSDYDDNQSFSDFNICLEFNEESGTFFNF